MLVRRHEAKPFASVAEAVAWYAALGYDSASYDAQTRIMLRVESTNITGRVIIEHSEVLLAVAHETEWR